VPFAKVMNPGFADEYIGCSVIVRAQFVASGAGAWVLPFSTDDKVIFRVLPPGAVGEKNPLSGEVQANFVALPKTSDRSDLVFELQPGDLVQLTGGTHVATTAAGGFKSITFMASDVSRAAQ
jgi:hypothetical protein